MMIKLEKDGRASCRIYVEDGVLGMEIIPEGQIEDDVPGSVEALAQVALPWVLDMLQSENPEWWARRIVQGGDLTEDTPLTLQPSARTVNDAEAHRHGIVPVIDWSKG